MKLRGFPPEGFPALSYVGSPKGTIVGSLAPSLSHIVSVPGAKGNPGPTDFNLLDNVPDSFPPSEHTHTVSEVSGLQTALDAKATQAQLETALTSKVSKSGTANRVYSTNASGAEINQPYTSASTANTVVYRDGGGRSKFGDPVAGTDAANKQYVDAQVGTKANTSHTHLISEITGLQEALSNAGLPEAAVQALIDTALDQLLDGAPGALNTLNELANALGDDPNFAATVASQIAARVLDTDPRLSDSRTPKAHSHAMSEVNGLQTALGGKVDSTDTRLTNARQPTNNSVAWAQLHSELQTLLASISDDLNSIPRFDHQVVSSMPGSPVAGRVYFVTG